MLTKSQESPDPSSRDRAGSLDKPLTTNQYMEEVRKLEAEDLKDEFSTPTKKQNELIAA